jgi:signal transduction histidine kinase
MGSTRRWSSHVVCVMGLLLALLAYRTQWSYSAFPDEFPAESLAYPLMIGTYTADTPQQLRFLAESWPPGAAVAILDADGGTHHVTLVLRQGPVGLVVAGIGGLAFLATALFFFAPRSDRPGVRNFLWISLLYGLAIMVGGVYFPREQGAWLTFLGLTQIACLAALPALFLHLSLSFPRRSPFLDRRRWFVPLLSLAAAGVFAWQAAVHLRYFETPIPAYAARIPTPLAVADVFMIALTLAGIVILAVRRRRLERTREQNQVGWLLWGFAIGATPYVLLRTVPELLGQPPLMPDYVDRLVELAIPFGFVMAVVRHQFLDIDVIIRRSLLYGLLAAALVGLYLVAGLVFGSWLRASARVEQWITPVIVGLVAGIAFIPLRRTLGRWLDRTLFKLAHDRDVVLARLDAQLNRVASRQELADATRDAIERVLLARSLAVVIAREGVPAVSGEVPAGLLDTVGARPAGTVLVAAHQATAVPEVEDGAFSPPLRRAGFVLDQPLVVQDEAAGRILVGGRANERRYVEPDLAFLAGCARVAGQHLERVALLQTVAAETLARERLAEVDRLKSEFLAQVAHDLRTPVTGIGWSARNLSDGIVGELNAEQREYVQSIAQSCEHLNRLVSNLLEISRMDRGKLELGLAAITPALAWRQALGTVAPLAQAKNVALELIEREPGATARGHADKLVEVAVNLLDNAIKYTAPDSTVTVTIGAPTGGGLDASVRDQGPGLGGQAPEDLFARFAQGAPSPSSSRQGFGLGLHIVVTYLELMGGTLTARDHPEGGAEFTCRLPLAATAPAGREEGQAP